MDVQPAEQEMNLSEAFKALGHPHRLAIVRRLIDRAITCEPPEDGCCQLDPACCGFGELAEQLDISKGTVSHHVKELWRAGLLDKQREGRRIFCRINEERLAELRAFLAGDASRTSGELLSTYSLLGKANDR